ncbi:DUF7319 domain-containing protein [Halocatena pleomorpha]|uniref:DUF7319 domain-containing protein n=1 Tax=Halocatena pleomorpha TaxID=1785090 RepID=A0A3P3RET2_9EURY|nr:hypothetical protein [Halocatena pleomorpha]RRJ32012.1 hypothetical protein EIK79_05645 [Halocatena pleomorpha]
MSGDGSHRNDDAPAGSSDDGEPAGSDTEEPSVEALRRQVEEKYDFDDFGPRDMERMTPEEWDAAFDPETWITGTELLDRVEADMKQRIADRDVFARIERLSDPDRLVAYSDEGYAVVFGDGSVKGEGIVLRDIKPSVALCSMDEYEAPELQQGEVLPHPSEVPEGSGSLGHRMMLFVGVAMAVMGVLLIGSTVVSGSERAVIGTAFGLGFIVVGVVLFVIVANARLSDRFRSEEYRDRLRAVGRGSDEQPTVLDELETDDDDATDESGDTPSHGL